MSGRPSIPRSSNIRHCLCAHADSLIRPPPFDAADSRRAYDAGRYATRPSNAAAPQASTTTLRERNEGTFGGVGPVDPESADAFREAMHRSAARVKDGARMRASLSRLQRAQVDVPPVGTVSAKFALPFIAAGIWVVNWALFMR